MTTKRNASILLRIFREGAGITAAFITVMAFIVVGFAQMTAVVLWGLEVAAPDAWFSGLLSLSSACMGYLIGKHIERPAETQRFEGYNESPQVIVEEAGGTCPHCGLPLKAQ